MLSKLAWRNAKRSWKDYGVYLLTMVLIMALIYGFDGILFSPQMRSICQEASIMACMLGLATAFIIMITAWLIHYMVRFMMERRSREFGTYMLLGMRRKQIIALFMKESCILGGLAFLMGILPGMLLEQILTALFYGMYGAVYELELQFSWLGFLMTVCVYGGTYFYALLRSRRAFRKLNIQALMNLESQNQRTEKHPKVYCIVFLLSLCYMAVYCIYMMSETVSLAGFFVTTFLMGIAIYLFYVGASGFVAQYLKKGGRGIYKGSNLFILRQFASKIKTMRFTFGTLTIFFLVTLLGITCAAMLQDYQRKQLESDLPFDVLVFSDDPASEFQEQRDVVKTKAVMEQELIYRIYQNGSTSMNDYLYENLSYFEHYEDPEEPEYDGVTNEYFAYDTYMKLSDYNTLRRMLGLKEVELSDDGYLIQVKERLKEEIQGFCDDHPGCEGIYTDAFAQNGINGADYLLIVPDQVAEEMEPLYSVYAADVENPMPQDLYDALSKLQNYEDEDGDMHMDLIWGIGTNQIISCVDTTLVGENQIAEMKYILLCVVYPLLYIAVVFVCTALTVLTVQQLADAGKYRYQYSMLFKLGMRREEIRQTILKQMGIYFFTPYVAAVVLSGILALYMSSRFVFYTGIKSNVCLYYGVSLGSFTFIYLIYFILCVRNFDRAVLK